MRTCSVTTQAPRRAEPVLRHVEFVVAARPDRILLAPGLEISRVVTGLWQVADMERDGRTLDRDAAAAAMAEYARGGFDSFDMADHYGSAELIAGRFLKMVEAGNASAFTKWCPAPGVMTGEVVRAGIAERLERLGVETIDLLQLQIRICSNVRRRLKQERTFGPRH